jgi:hypothetical protein
MTARRNPDGDWPRWRRLVNRASSAVRRALASRGEAVAAPDEPYLVVPILGQSNAFGMGRPLDLAGADRPHSRVHQWAMCGPSKGTAVLAADPLLHEIPARGAAVTRPSTSPQSYWPCEGSIRLQSMRIRSHVA